MFSFQQTTGQKCFQKLRPLSLSAFVSYQFALYVVFEEMFLPLSGLSGHLIWNKLTLDNDTLLPASDKDFTKTFTLFQAYNPLSMPTWFHLCATGKMFFLNFMMAGHLFDIMFIPN